MRSGRRPDPQSGEFVARSRSLHRDGALRVRIARPVIERYDGDAMTPAERLARVLEEQRAFETYDSEMGRNPHSPERAVEELLVAPEMVPFLIGVLETDAPGGEFAVLALELLGPPGRAAADVLERRGEGPALFSVDEARARALGLHREKKPREPNRSTRSRIARIVVRSGDQQRIRAHHSELLRDADPSVVAFALDRFPHGDDRSQLHALLLEGSSAAPLEALRELLDVPNDRLAQLAAHALSLAHEPEDALRVMTTMLRQVGSNFPREKIPVQWLASLPGSDALLDLGPSANELYDLIRRRRCAGLPIPTARFRTAALRVLAKGENLGGEIVRELHDASFLGALLQALGEEAASHKADIFVPIATALLDLGDEARAAVRDRAAVASPESAYARAHVYIERCAARPRWAGDRSRPDQLFLDGTIDDRPQESENAFARYGAFLRYHPHDAYTAYQLAWIDRAFGSSITPERIAYLQGLGVQQTLLDELAARPSAIVAGYRTEVARGGKSRPDADKRARAEAAGLPGLAATFASDDQERDRLRSSAVAHLARVRAGCRTPVLPEENP